MEFVLIWLVFAVVVGVIASNRRRSGLGWFLLSLVLSPLLGLILVLALGSPRVEPATDGEHKKCPACAEWVKKDALKCRYCGEQLAAAGSGPGATTSRVSGEAELKDALERERAVALEKLALRKRRKAAEGRGRALGSFIAARPIVTLLLVGISIAGAYYVFWR